jgi:xylulokinase
LTPLFAGLDVSTQSCKLVVIDPAAPSVLLVTAVNYDRDLPHYGTRDGIVPGLGPGVAESDPRMWLEAVDAVFHRLADSGVPRDRIRCLSVSGQQHGLVALDDDGRLTRPRSKLWNDVSTHEECRWLTDRLGGPETMLTEIGNLQRPGYTAGKILHLVRHEPEAYQKASTLFIVHNYINWYLTGGIRRLDPGEASGLALWNPRTGRWSERMISAIHPDLYRKLPSITSADAVIGSISTQLAERFGLSPLCLIAAGSGDNQLAALGTGHTGPGRVTVSLGTSGTVCTVHEQPPPAGEGTIALYRDCTGRYLSLLCVSNLANGYNALRREYDLSHEEFERMTALMPPGNEGRLLIPWYDGERTPDLPQAAPVHFGFGPEDFRPEILCRAVLEGHILNLYEGYRLMNLQPAEIRLTGGLTQSAAWCQTIADIFAAEAVPVRGEGAALGAALHAAWVWGRATGEPQDLDDIVAPFVILDESRRARPRDSCREIVQLQRRLFRCLSRRLRGETGEDPFRLRHNLRTLSG